MSALDTLDPAVCPDCGADLRTLNWGQPALFKHGGYGATTATERRHCPCSWSLIAAITTQKPQRAPIAAPESGSLAPIDDPGDVGASRGPVNTPHGGARHAG